mmetsp:Transcript_36788/g.59467  ORF Transcript_36788/g.59467 Transcript_36788/m.59467 type:complete len:200 (-) Transcript_36788:7536-8135(-)
MPSRSNGTFRRTICIEHLACFRKSHERTLPSDPATNNNTFQALQNIKRGSFSDRSGESRERNRFSQDQVFQLPALPTLILVRDHHLATIAKTHKEIPHTYVKNVLAECHHRGHIVGTKQTLALAVRKVCRVPVSHQDALGFSSRPRRVDNVRHIASVHLYVQVACLWDQLIRHDLNRASPREPLRVLRLRDNNLHRGLV